MSPTWVLTGTYGHPLWLSCYWDGTQHSAVGHWCHKQETFLVVFRRVEPGTPLRPHGLQLPCPRRPRCPGWDEGRQEGSDRSRP